MPPEPRATSSTFRGIGNEVSTTSQVAATWATDVPAVAPRSVQALIAAGLRSNTTTSWLVLRLMLRHMGPPMFPTPMKPTFIAVPPPLRSRYLPACRDTCQHGVPAGRWTGRRRSTCALAVTGSGLDPIRRSEYNQPRTTFGDRGNGLGCHCVIQGRVVFPGVSLAGRRIATP